MYLTNEMNYGHLIDPENFNVSLVEPELFEVFNNVKVTHRTAAFCIELSRARIGKHATSMLITNELSKRTPRSNK